MDGTTRVLRAVKLEVGFLREVLLVRQGVNWPGQSQRRSILAAGAAIATAGFWPVLLAL